MYLFDTVTVSALRRPERSPLFSAWAKTIDLTEIFISVITYGELQRGTTQQASRNPAFALTLENWLEDIRLNTFDRTLPLTLGIALEWGRLSARLGRTDVDLMIAATALVHDLTVVTRNVAHFTPTGARVLNPFDA